MLAISLVSVVTSGTEKPTNDYFLICKNESVSRTNCLKERTVKKRASILGVFDDDKSKLLPSNADDTTVCPPKDFQVVQDFDLDDYVSSKWYAQEQMQVRFQPASDFYCINAQYVREGRQDIAVFNYARRDSVQGKVQSVQLKAHVPDLDEPAKILVGPRFLPTFLMGPYWVVAIGKYPNSNNSTFSTDRKYDWVVVSGGAPKILGKDGKCKVGDGKDGNGLWILTRDPLIEQSVLDHIRQIASDKGYDLSVLQKVVQEGCDYTFEH